MAQTRNAERFSHNEKTSRPSKPTEGKSDGALSAFLDLEDEIRTAHDLISIVADLAEGMGDMSILFLALVWAGSRFAR